MKEYTTEQIQERFARLPKELQEALSSLDMSYKVKEVGERHGLRIDQIGELVDQIGLVMLGFGKSSTFVNDIASRLSIDTSEANAITEDVSGEIFAAIRTHLQELEKKAESEQMDSAKESGIADLEQIGGFSIEKEKVQTEAVSLKVPEKDRILSSIEDQTADPLIDHLLASPNGQVEQKILQKPESHHTKPAIPANLPTGTARTPEKQVMPAPASAPATAPKPPDRPSGPDQYREPIN